MKHRVLRALLIVLLVSSRTKEKEVVVLEGSRRAAQVHAGLSSIFHS